MRSLFPQPNPSLPPSSPPPLASASPSLKKLPLRRRSVCLERAVRVSCQLMDQHVCETTVNITFVVICGWCRFLVEILLKTQGFFNWGFFYKRFGEFTDVMPWLTAINMKWLPSHARTNKSHWNQQHIYKQKSTQTATATCPLIP